jgi:hypothetical protein
MEINYQEVFGFEISMNDLLGVEIKHGFGEIMCDLNPLFPCRLSISQHGAHVSSFHKFCNDIEAGLMQTYTTESNNKRVSYASLNN